jgi:hypothetical protein
MECGRLRPDSSLVQQACSRSQLPHGLTLLRNMHIRAEKGGLLAATKVVRPLPWGSDLPTVATAGKPCTQPALILPHVLAIHGGLASAVLGSGMGVTHVKVFMPQFRPPLREQSLSSGARALSTASFRVEMDTMGSLEVPADKYALSAAHDLCK